MIAMNIEKLSTMALYCDKPIAVGACVHATKLINKIMIANFKDDNTTTKKHNYSQSQDTYNTVL